MDFPVFKGVSDVLLYSVLSLSPLLVPQLLTLVYLPTSTMSDTMEHIDRKSLYTSLEARIDYLHKFLDFDDRKSPQPPPQKIPPVDPS